MVWHIFPVSPYVGHVGLPSLKRNYPCGISPSVSSRYVVAPTTLSPKTLRALRFGPRVEVEGLFGLSVFGNVGLGFRGLRV